MKKTVVIEGRKEDIAKLEAMLALCNLTIVGTEANTTKATTKAVKTEYALPYTVDGTKVTIGTDDYLPTKVFNAVKYCIKQNGGTWDKDNKIWKFKTRKAVEAFEKAWKNGSKK